MELRGIKKKKYEEQGGICAGCNKPMRKDEYLHLSHQLPQRTWLKKKYGEDVIHHELNMKLTHANDLCNQRVQMSPNKTALVEAHVKAIKAQIHEDAMQQVWDRR
jgi:hypothetical protein